MAIVSHKHRVVYFPLAKNCSTSLKHFFFELETGRKFREAKSLFKLVGHVHTYFPTQVEEKWYKFYNSYETIAVVRDPISRFLSGYGNRILNARALETRGNVVETLKSRGLPTIPDLNTFIELMNEYMEISSYTRNHFSPQFSVIGEIFGKINLVYPISRVSEIPNFFAEKRGVLIKLPHEQSAGKKFTLDDLSRDQLEKLVEFYKEDYEMLKEYFKPPSPK